MHILEVDMYCKCEEKNHTSIDTLEIETTCITRQLEYYKLQLTYPENITHNNRRIPILTYILRFNFALVIFFVNGVETVIGDNETKCGYKSRLHIGFSKY